MGRGQLKLQWHQVATRPPLPPIISLLRCFFLLSPAAQPFWLHHHQEKKLGQQGREKSQGFFLYLYFIVWLILNSAAPPLVPNSLSLLAFLPLRSVPILKCFPLKPGFNPAVLRRRFGFVFLSYVHLSIPPLSTHLCQPILSITPTTSDSISSLLSFSPLPAFLKFDTEKKRRR